MDSNSLWRCQIVKSLISAKGFNKRDELILQLKRLEYDNKLKTLVMAFASRDWKLKSFSRSICFQLAISVFFASFASFAQQMKFNVSLLAYRIDWKRCREPHIARQQAQGIQRVSSNPFPCFVYKLSMTQPQIPTNFDKFQWQKTKLAQNCHTFELRWWLRSREFDFAVITREFLQSFCAVFT